MKLAQRIHRIDVSPTLALSAKVKALKASGRDIIDLSAGEPDFDTPEFIKQAAVNALKKGFTKYTAVDGISALKKAIAKKFWKENKLRYSEDEIIVSCGAKHSIFNLVNALIEKGDEVIIPAPYWVSYTDIIKLADGVPRIIPTNMRQRFKITPQQLEKNISTKTKLFILNSPSNPSGAVYTKAELKTIGHCLEKYPNVFILSDDIYEHILWNKEGFYNILNVCPKLSNRTAVINGVSKTYAMTGWRIGYAAGPKEIIEAMKKIQSQTTSNPNSFAQFGAAAALTRDQTFVKKIKKKFQARHDLLFKELKNIPGFQCIPSSGTFYSFPNVEEAIKRIDVKNDIAFSEYLLRYAGVATVPGTAFGSPDHIRLSFTQSEKILRQAAQRIKNILR